MSNIKIGIINYGLGNLGSIFNMLAPRSANDLVQNAPEIIPVKSNMYKSDKLLFVGFVIIVGLMNFT